MGGGSSKLKNKILGIFCASVFYKKNPNIMKLNRKSCGLSTLLNK
jgi:hypothetical protein